MKFIEAATVIALLMIISGAIYRIYRQRTRLIPSLTRLTPAQLAQLSSSRQALLQCASAAGNTRLIRDLNRMRFGGAMTDLSADELDANALTVGRTTYFSPGYFSTSICQQFRTMLHEASRVGGNYADEQNDPQGLIRLEQAEEQAFRELAACLGCCHEYPMNPPPGCGSGRSSGSSEIDRGFA